MCGSRKTLQGSLLDQMWGKMPVPRVSSCSAAWETQILLQTLPLTCRGVSAKPSHLALLTMFVLVI